MTVSHTSLRRLIIWISTGQRRISFGIDDRRVARNSLYAAANHSAPSISSAIALALSRAPLRAELGAMRSAFFCRTTA